ncbi:hypothetical protein D0Z07_2187 [Hyphodiscus hymeniophilus]|uniref:Transcription factor domain-containing protein n=1 Tax=Hyphodiscus hymeniophilus TaxID=353542 RepID=A0A9P7AZH6_9HELO|nr:hypothetical protein D0Z07_2187 [Hyphodiscus hymeniophilus]
MVTENLSDYSPQNGLLLSTILRNLVDLFFKHVFTWAPILNSDTISAVLSGSYSTLNEEDNIPLHAIVATTVRFSEDPAFTEESRSRYREISKQKVHTHAALALLAADALGSSDGPEGGKILALLVRSVVRPNHGAKKSVVPEPSLGFSNSVYYVGAEALHSQDWIENEGRQTLAKFVYILTNYATAGATLGFTLSEDSMDMLLPCQYDLFQKNDLAQTQLFSGQFPMITAPSDIDYTSSFSCHCEVLRIFSRIHRLCQDPVDIMSLVDVQHWSYSYCQLDDELDGWLSGLPREYGSISQLCRPSPPESVSNWIMVHATYILSVTRLHSTAYSVMQSHMPLYSHNAMQKCHVAIESLRIITRFAIDTSVLRQLGFPFAFVLWTSARLLLVYTASLQCEFDLNIWFLIETLEKMAQQWAVAGSYAKSLRDVVCIGQKNKSDAIQYLSSLDDFFVQ